MTTKGKNAATPSIPLQTTSTNYGEPYWMVRVTVAVWMVEPPVAVTVTA